jgi:hypothetical protein
VDLRSSASPCRPRAERGEARRRQGWGAMDQRLESFLTDLLAFVGKEPT